MPVFASAPTQAQPRHDAPAAPPADFNLQPPAATPATNPAPPAGPATSPATGSAPGTAIAAAALPGDGSGLSPTGAVAGTAILLLLAVAILFIRAAVRSHLIAARASPSAAGSAGWALAAFLMALSVLIVFGLLGDLWPVPAFTLPLLLLIAVSLVLFVLLFRAAARGRTAPRRFG